MGQLSTIKSNVWGLSLVGYGAIAEGLASIRQCIGIIIRTTKGSDPLRPQFGSEVYKFIDAPIGVAIPNIKNAMIEALTIWEKRIRVTEIRHRVVEAHHLEFEIVYTLVDQDIIDTLLYDLNSGVLDGDSQSGKITLQAFYPPNPTGKRYGLSFMLNGSQALPVPPETGFSSLDDLFTWVKTNWAFYGNWYKLSDRIVLDVKNEIDVRTASIAISLLSAYEYMAYFPGLLPGQTYRVLFSIDGNVVYPTMPLNFNSPGQVLSWARVHWANYGNWEVSSTYGQTGEFSSEFSELFNIPAENGYLLKLYSDRENVELSISVAGDPVLGNAGEYSSEFSNEFPV